MPLWNEPALAPAAAGESVPARAAENELASARAAQSEQGNAIVEFIGVMVVIIVPALVLLSILSTIVSAQFALQSAARESARVFVRANAVAEAKTSADAAAETAWKDRGFTEPLTISYTCSAPACLTPNATVTANVRAQITLPLIGRQVTVQDSQPMTVDAFRAARP